MEIILVLVIALLVFGPNRLPQAGRSLGRAVREFKRATDTAKSELGLNEVIDDFKGVKSDITGVKDGLKEDLKGTGATEALSAVKTGLSPIDLKGGATSVAKSIVSGGGANAAAAVDRPVQVAPSADDEGWPQGVAAPAADGAPAAAEPADAAALVPDAGAAAGGRADT